MKTLSALFLTLLFLTCRSMEKKPAGPIILQFPPDAVLKQYVASSKLGHDVWENMLVAQLGYRKIVHSMILDSLVEYAIDNYKKAYPTNPYKVCLDKAAIIVLVSNFPQSHLRRL